MAPSKLVKLFHEVCALDDNAREDEVSPDAFSMLCTMHGIFPPAKYSEDVSNEDIAAEKLSYAFEGAVCELPAVVLERLEASL